MFFEPYGIGAAVAGSFLFPVMPQKRNRCPFWFRFFVRWFRSRYSLRGFFSKNRFFWPFSSRIWWVQCAVSAAIIAGKWCSRAKNIFWEAFFVLRGACGNRCGAIGDCAFAVWQGVNGIFLSMNGLHGVILGSFSTCPGGVSRVFP